MNKKLFRLPYLVSLIALVVVSFIFNKGSYAVEQCSQIAEIGTCWDGYYALIADMANGDKLYLGRLDNTGPNPQEAANTRARLAIAITAQATGQSICYQPINPGAVCVTVRHFAEWWNLGGSVW